MSARTVRSRVDALEDQFDAWVDRPHPKLVRNVRRAVVAIDVFIGTPVVVWFAVHAVRMQSHPTLGAELDFFAAGLFTEFLVGALFLYWVAMRAIRHHWRPTTYRRAEYLALLLLLVACPVAVLIVDPLSTAPGPLGLVAVPVVLLWLMVMRDVVRRVWRQRTL